MASNDFFKTLDDRKRRLWAELCRSAARHPEWPRDAVEDFFLFWTENGRDGIMKFERLQDFSVVHRMGSFMKRRKWLTAVYTAKLERAQGAKSKGALDARRAAVMDAEAQRLYDSYFASQERTEKEENEKNEAGK